MAASSPAGFCESTMLGAVSYNDARLLVHGGAFVSHGRLWRQANVLVKQRRLTNGLSEEEGLLRVCVGGGDVRRNISPPCLSFTHFFFVSILYILMWMKMMFMDDRKEQTDCHVSTRVMSI